MRILLIDDTPEILWVQGDGTALHIQNEVAARFPGVQVTRLARGLPAGSNIEYANRNILADAISGRQRM